MTDEKAATQERRAGKTRDEVRETLFALMKQNARVDADAIREDARIGEDLRMDSLDLISVINEVEHEFKITIPDDQLKGIKTVGEVVDALWARLAGRP